MISVFVSSERPEDDCGNLIKFTAHFLKDAEETVGELCVQEFCLTDIFPIKDVEILPRSTWEGSRVLELGPMHAARVVPKFDAPYRTGWFSHYLWTGR